MPFTTNLSGTTELDNSLVAAFDQQFILAAGEEQNIDQLASYKQNIGAKSIAMTKYALTAPATTPLVETDDITSVAMSDSEILITPVEYGFAITRTELASLQSGGKIDAAAAKLVGMNLSQTKNELACAVLAASANQTTVAGGAAAAVAAGDIMTEAFLNKMYNKLSRASVQKLNGQYVAVMHDDVAHDLRASASAGSWMDVGRYAEPGKLLQNEIGMYRGFKIVVNNASSLLTADEGALAVDNYRSLFLGFNALGLVESKPTQLVISGPFDKLARFLNIGWKGCFKYSIIDTAAVQVGVSSSSVGVNV